MVLRASGGSIFATRSLAKRIRVDMKTLDAPSKRAGVGHTDREKLKPAYQFVPLPIDLVAEP